MKEALENLTLPTSDDEKYLKRETDAKLHVLFGGTRLVKQTSPRTAGTELRPEMVAVWAMSCRQTGQAAQNYPLWGQEGSCQQPGFFYVSQKAVGIITVCKVEGDSGLRCNVGQCEEYRVQGVKGAWGGVGQVG